MDNKNRLKVFETEIGTIKNKNIKKFAKLLIENADDWFFKLPASTSGKYHPEYANVAGGLLLHTKAVILILNEIIETEVFSFSSDERDLLRVAALAHDIKKIGKGENEYTVKDHPHLAAMYVNSIYEANNKLLKKDEVDYICHAIEYHMGKWSKVDISQMSDGDKILHIADVLASRKMIEISFDRNEVKKTEPNLNEYIVDFGMHKGKHLNEIPFDYLQWCLDNVKKPIFISMVKKFIKENKKAHV